MKHIKTLKWTLILMLMSTGSLVMAQEEIHEVSTPIRTFETFNNEIGMHAGFTTGLGLSYRHWFKKVGGQLTFLPIKTSNLEFYSAGVSLMYKFMEKKYVSTYGYIGYHYIYKKTVDEYYTNSSILVTVEDLTDKKNSGVGIGFTFGREVAFNIMCGYGMYDIEGEFNLLPTIEGGLYFRF